MPHSTSLSTVLLFFGGALILSTLLLSRVTKIGWKRLDMAALLLGGFGLFPVTFDSQKWFTAGERDASKELAEENARYTIKAFDMWWTQQNCEAAVHPEVQQRICKWLEDQKENIRGRAEQLLSDKGEPRETGSEFPIAIDRLRDFPSEAEPAASYLMKVAVWYNASTNGWLAVRNKPKQLTFLEGMNNLVTAFSAVFGPYSLALALALKLTQIRSEIAEEKKKAADASRAGDSATGVSTGKTGP